MDVTDDEFAALGFKQILKQTGRSDVLVNNAGCGSYGALEDVSLEEARRWLEVNVFGAAAMREQGSGTIINITSMGGKLHTPLGA